MATIGIDIKTNFDEASSQLKAFTGTTEQETDRINKALQRLSGFEADSFVQKNKRIAASVTMTRGAAQGLEAEQRGLERQMQMMVRNGMNPEDEALRKLQAEYAKTSQQIEINAKAHKIGEAASKAASRTMMVMGAAAIGAGLALFKNTQDTAKRGDVFAKQSAIIGTTAEELQKLAYVADLAGVPQEELTNAMKKLNKGMGEARLGGGSLKDVLEKTNPALLAQLNATTDSSAAFDLMINAMHKTTNAQDRATLATAAFGKAGQNLANISAMSAEEIKKLKDEAVKYGIISNASAKSSEEFLDAQTRMKAAITGVRNSIGVALMPVIQKAVEWFTALVGTGGNLEATLKSIAPYVVGIGVALAGMFVINKIIALVQGFKTSMIALKVVLMSHPILLLVAGLAALAAIFLTSGKSAAEYETEISDAEKTTKQLQFAISNQGNAFEVFQAAAKKAAHGTAQFSLAVDALLKKTPELAQYGITVSSSLKEIEEAQRMLTDAQAASNIIKADEQFKKLEGSLSGLRNKMIEAWDTFKDDPTQANLAMAKQYVSQVMRSETAMKSLGEQSGRSSAVINSAIDDAWGRLRKFNNTAYASADAMEAIGSASLDSLAKVSSVIPGMSHLMDDFMRKMPGRSAPNARNAPPPGSGIKIKDISAEIAAIKAKNDMMERLAGDHARKMEQIEIDHAANVAKLMADNALSTQQTDAMILESYRKMMMERKALHDTFILTRMSKEEEAAKALLDLEEKTNAARLAFGMQLVEGFSQIMGGLQSLTQAETANKIAALEARQKGELDSFKGSAKEKEKLQKIHEKEKAKIEYNGAMASWRLQMAAGIADGARMILSAFLTKPFIPAGIAAGAVATAMAGIQLATLKASKPKMSAETGGRFVVPDSIGSSRGDSQTMRVNPGEQVQVSARGEGGRALNVKVVLDRRVLMDFVQNGFDSGELTITADNLVAR